MPTSHLFLFGVWAIQQRAYTVSQRKAEQPREFKLLAAVLPPGLRATVPSFDRVIDSGVHCSSVSGKCFQNYRGSLETKEKEEWRHLAQPLPGPTHTKICSEPIQNTFWVLEQVNVSLSDRQ